MSLEYGILLVDVLLFHVTNPCGNQPAKLLISL
uniref:Uncharacterized protein n=1 Tax=Anguilla anguilla TaxID=7936 RepID=A0A0E9SXF6_ANGAN